VLFASADGAATLHGQGAGDGGEHCAKELDNLDDEFPVEFH